MKNEVEFYVELLELLGRKLSVGKLRVLRFVNENRQFSVPDLVDAMDMRRGDMYPIIQFFEKKGLVEKIMQPPLPEGAEEWSVGRRMKYKKQVGITTRQYYRFNPGNMIKLVDRKIERLKAMKTLLIEGKEDE